MEFGLNCCCTDIALYCTAPNSTLMKTSVCAGPLADCPGCNKGYSWDYYAPTPSFIWTAPAAIPEVCYGENDLNLAGQPCGSGSNGAEWSKHVHTETLSNGAPIFDALYNCTLHQITWVIPDKMWSDHSTETGLYGPSFVGDIIDAVGGGMSGSSCNGTNSGKYWTQEPTAIFVLWDDWGGWFDHVAPPAVYHGTLVNGQPECTANNAPNGWGCGYVYGFRVPLLVVSEYTKAGYVSGPCNGTSCRNDTFPYQHDFGSILAFTEYNFGMSFIDQSGKKGYADFNALDGANQNIPLSDFFKLSDQRNFFSIPTDKSYTYFQNHSQYDSTWAPDGPDAGDSD
jgi:hypothetical protein